MTNWKATPSEAGLRISLTIFDGDYSQLTEETRDVIQALKDLTSPNGLQQVGDAEFLIPADVLWVNVRPSSFQIDYSGLETLADVYALITGQDLPDEMPVRVELSAVRPFYDPSFAITAKVAPDVDAPVKGERIGPFIQYQDGTFDLLPVETAQLLDTITTGWPASAIARLSRWNALKSKVADAGFGLDAILREEHAIDRHLAESWTDPADDIPKSQSGNPIFTSTETFSGLLGAPRGPLIGPSRRVPLPPISAFRPDQPLFPSLPDEPEDFDLTDFSKRVTGIGVRIYRAIPYFEGDGKSRQWFEWDGNDDDNPELKLKLESSDPNEQLDDIDLSDPDTRSNLNDRLEQAGADADLVDIGNGAHINAKTLRKFLGLADKFSRAKSPEQRKSYVLEIYTNLNQEEYSEGSFVDIRTVPMLKPPVGLDPKVRLYHHQLQGYSWLVSRSFDNGPRGALLADDMGLGKTLQAMCLVARRREMGVHGPVLIVCPLSTMENWSREIQKFFPRLFRRVLPIRSAHMLSEGRLFDDDVCLTTYESLRGGLQMAAGKVNWDVLILDEAQKAKNSATITSDVVKALKTNYRLALTATPVENTLAELWNIVDFIVPSYLSSLAEFKDIFVHPWKSATDEQKQLLANDLSERLNAVLLRRLKEDVLDLPAKTITRTAVPMSPLQQQLYMDIVHQMKNDEIKPIVAIQKLLDVCAHPVGGGLEFLNESCPKLEQTLGILRHARDRGEKCIVFANKYIMQEMLQEHIRRAGLGFADIINGKTNGLDRQPMIDAFSSSPNKSVLILGPRAAGLGLNITAATHVIHYTRHWNPAVETQATDRAHRIGQTRPVTVHLPIVTGQSGTSVEQILDKLLMDKSTLARSVVRPTSELNVTENDILQGIGIRR
jgi:superfamily II DNA or RNA helicase